jgi:hypothetical protein
MGSPPSSPQYGHMLFFLRFVVFALVVLFVIGADLVFGVLFAGVLGFSEGLQVRGEWHEPSLRLSLDLRKSQRVPRRQLKRLSTAVLFDGAFLGGKSQHAPEFFGRYVASPEGDQRRNDELNGATVLDRHCAQKRPGFFWDDCVNLDVQGFIVAQV